MSAQLGAGPIRKMHAALGDPVSYVLPLGGEEISLNPYLGRALRLTWQGEIRCIYCDRQTRKSFNQGYCYPCFQRLARCDACIVSPEKCHFAAGTCREPDWAQDHCMTDHIVYLANTSGIKVGITRASQVPTRWMDQGATQARPILRVATRLHSGLAEALLRAHVADRTDWRAMLRGPGEARDLETERQRLMAECAAGLEEVRAAHGLQSITELADQAETAISYPVLQYPAKVTAFNLDKAPVAEGTLTGIKGQYLIFDTGVINMRKYGGYRLLLETSG